MLVALKPDDRQAPGISLIGHSLKRASMGTDGLKDREGREGAS